MIGFNKLIRVSRVRIMIRVRVRAGFRVNISIRVIIAIEIINLLTLLYIILTAHSIRRVPNTGLTKRFFNDFNADLTGWKSTNLYLIV